MNSNAKPTPGPWHCRIMENGQPCAVAGANDRTVAWVDFWQDKTCASQLDIDEQKANAELIASAPELLAQRNALLEALQTLVKSTCALEEAKSTATDDALTCLEGRLETAIDQARNAIALAQGDAK